MAKNDILIADLLERKTELESLKTAKEAEIDAVKLKLETARSLVNKMHNKVLKLEAVKDYDPEYVESEISTTNGLKQETSEKVAALQLLLREKENELIQLENEYITVGNGHMFADDETLQVEALEIAINALQKKRRLKL